MKNPVHHRKACYTLDDYGTRKAISKLCNKMLIKYNLQHKTFSICHTF